MVNPCYSEYQKAMGFNGQNGSLISKLGATDGYPAKREREPYGFGATPMRTGAKLIQIASSRARLHNRLANARRLRIWNKYNQYKTLVQRPSRSSAPKSGQTGLALQRIFTCAEQSRRPRTAPSGISMNSGRTLNAALPWIQDFSPRTHYPGSYAPISSGIPNPANQTCPRNRAVSKRFTKIFDCNEWQKNCLTARTKLSE
ncbi:MAG: hypothetical protein ACU843_07315 [Gammaproteobacteria bacterium]